MPRSEQKGARSLIALSGSSHSGTLPVQAGARDGPVDWVHGTYAEYSTVARFQVFATQKDAFEQSTRTVTDEFTRLPEIQILTVKADAKIRLSSGTGRDESSP